MHVFDSAVNRSSVFKCHKAKAPVAVCVSLQHDLGRSNELRLFLDLSNSRTYHNSDIGASSCNYLHNRIYSHDSKGHYH
uniref:Uncharacterized protein n=1 Tax=Arundo donax TaxID=35708 RepID=A0A0A9F704_ARUDO